MKIYTKVTFNFKTGEVLEEVFHEWDGEVSECKGGTTTTTQSPPTWQIPYLTDVYGQAQELSKNPTTVYPGQTVAGFTPEQSLAQGLTTSRALLGSPLQKAGQGEALKTIQGDYLSPDTNPWLAQTYNEAANNISNKFKEITMPGIKNAAMGAGAYGGSRQGVSEGIAQRGLADELQNAATNIYGPAYTQERSLQNQMIQAAPTMAAADYNDISKLAAVGEEQQAMEQAQIDEAIKRYQYEQMEPWQRLGMYSNLVTGDVGGTGSSMVNSSILSKNPLAAVFDPVGVSGK